MTVDLQFDHDLEFSKLLARRMDVDVTRVALEIARDAQPNLDFTHTIEWISRRASEMTIHIARARSDRAILKEMSRCLFGTHGLHGDKQAYERAESSYINRVIETGVGIPISLSLVYLAVAQRSGVDMSGVAAPMHFLVRLDSMEGPLFLDAFHEGQILNLDDCCSWLESLSGLSTDQIELSLEPASVLEIVVRMLNNLKAVHARHQNWSDMWSVQRRLTALHPGTYEHNRDLAIIALKSNHPGMAFDLLENCLRNCPEKDRSLLQGHLQLAEKMLAMLN